MRRVATFARAVISTVVILMTLATLVAGQETQPRFGGSYSALDARANTSSTTGSPGL